MVFINKEQGRPSKIFKLSREHASFPEGLQNHQGSINRLRNSLNVWYPVYETPTLSTAA